MKSNETTKLYFRKLCLIVFGALLAVQSASSAEKIELFGCLNIDNPKEDPIRFGLFGDYAQSGIYGMFDDPSRHTPGHWQNMPLIRGAGGNQVIFIMPQERVNDLSFAYIFYRDESKLYEVPIGELFLEGLFEYKANVGSRYRCMPRN